MDNRDCFLLRPDVKSEKDILANRRDEGDESHPSLYRTGRRVSL